MLLSLLIIIPLLSSIFSLFSYKIKKTIPRWIALLGTILIFFITIIIFLEDYNSFFMINNHFNWSRQLIIPWIIRFGIEFNIAIDGFSIIMLLFASVLSIIAILSSWNEIKENEGFFYCNFMFVMTGIIGIFIACDLFLFFCFWEIMLLPMYFLIVLWSDQNKKNKIIIAANKFFIYGQTSGLILLSSILLIVFSYYHSTNILTFNYNILLHANINKDVEYIAMIGFFLAFIIKMPIVPLHGWLPNLHSKSISCGSVEIIGVLFKTAPYALIRYNLVLFPNTTNIFAPIAMFLGLLSIFYGAWIAFSQKNIKKFIAYSSISHMGLILIAIYSNNEIALQGIIIQILSSSLTTTALCILSGQLYKFFQTHNINVMRGLWSCIYWVPGLSLFFALSNLGIPGTGNFIGEFLILSGVFQIFPFIAILATIGIVFSSVYSLNFIQNIFYGSCEANNSVMFIPKRILFITILLVCILIFLGLYPQAIINISYNSIHTIQKRI
ncbi:NADH-quinone oxidoreductase subunit M [Buchnera aphidicola]|uniref:NADH-quinone oxidoreductase subunit M n=1 Tax=Buchnera aphidicola str. Ua (Uroleucon ambrosiae) TaxID=1005057 RepID=G2LP40_BUCUM|nr:NADH-quinone oxidoreductase subunit M [Buchnera aphidicola]AEO07977.1 NADH dehydrogenase I chain M [Buchnera aphidicola str. Ua (Uroleucon ambrosiae)]